MPNRYRDAKTRKQWFEGLKYAEEQFELLPEELAEQALGDIVDCAYAFGDQNAFDEGIEDYLKYRRTVIAKLTA